MHAQTWAGKCSESMKPRVNTSRLSAHQKQRLSLLEPQLRDALLKQDHQTAEQTVGAIQELLRETGHETRLMYSKLLLFEAYMEAGHLEWARSGLIGIRSKVSEKTRLYLEATALLAICEIRRRDLHAATPHMRWVLSNNTGIQSRTRRFTFQRQMVERFNQEAIIAGLSQRGNEGIDLDDVRRKAEEAIQNKTDDEMFADLGRNIPTPVLRFITEVDRLSRKQLPSADVKQLPPAPELQAPAELGRTVFSSVQRVIWRTLCNPEGEIHKKWVQDRLNKVINAGWGAASITSILTDLNIAMKAVAIPVVALVIKLGIEVYCDYYKPTSVMDIRNKSD